MSYKNMFCKHCGKEINKTNKFCPYCGGRIEEIAISEREIPQKSEIKTYSSIFWKYFGVLFLLSICASVLGLADVGFLWILYLILIVIYTYSFCKMVNEAMLSIGKKNWWLLGLLVLIPIGFWIVFFVVRDQLKPHGKWGDKMSPLVILLIIPLIIAVIGILASIVLVSLGDARGKARDARRQSDIRQISLAMEMYYDIDRVYLTSSTLPKRIGLYLDPVPNDPTEGKSYGWIDNRRNNQQYCVYAQLEDGDYFAASREGTKLLNNKPILVNCW